MNGKPINLRHLRAFCEVAKCQSINRASKQVHLSQPAITHAIAKLESKLAVRLFERRNTGMFCTEPGTLFHDRVERALNLITSGAQRAILIGRRKTSGGFSVFQNLVTSVQLRALVAVSDSGNFSLAARSIGVSQPSLHRAARDMERLVGIKMFVRTSRGIYLTPAAQELAKHAKLAFAELEQGIMELDEWRGLDAGHIVVGTLPLARTFILPTAINSLSKQRPDVRISVIDGPYDDLLHALRHGEIDILIGALRHPTPIDDVIQTPLLDDTLAVVARTQHPLAQAKKISVADLSSYPWVVPRSGTPTRTRFNEMFIRANIEIPFSIVESSSMILVRSLLMDSDRLTLISAHQVRHEKIAGLLVALPFDTTGTERAIGFTTRRDWRPTITQQSFLQFLRKAGESAQYA
jgi:LysR family transcriptional regulator, regulator for genes of the gallate degradation pathway